MESSVEVSDQEVHIDLAFNCKCSTKVRLRSLCATPFKVQTSSPQKFMVNPPSGLIPPLSYATFQIILKPQAQLPQAFPRSPSDLFLIKTAQFPSSPGPAHHHEPVAVTSWFSSRRLRPGTSSSRSPLLAHSSSAKPSAEATTTPPRT